MKYNYFVLGYNGIDYFEKWYVPNKEVFQNTSLFIVDNGKQNIPNTLKNNILYTTNRNISCAGGWNLICDIGFKFMNLDKIIIGQEDAMISEDIFEALIQSTNENTICGTFNNSFDFSTYCIHRDTFNKVGKFDENLLMSGCEDDDYKYRCKLNNIQIKNLNVPNSYNISIANNSRVVPTKYGIHNADYVKRKWGEFLYKLPFNTGFIEYTKMFKEMYEYNDINEILELPSDIEYNKYRLLQNEF